MLGYALYAIFFVLLLCYLAEGYNEEKCHLQSVSSLVCMRREVGAYALSLGNLIISLIAFRSDPVTAWCIWLSGQGVVCFFLDTSLKTHHFFLSCYIVSLIVFSVHACERNVTLWIHSYPMLLFSVLFGGAVIVNNTCGEWHFLSIQAILELLWILSFVYFTNIYEKSIVTM
jgi:hypothetical protein